MVRNNSRRRIRFGLIKFDYLNELNWLSIPKLYDHTRMITILLIYHAFDSR